MSSIIKISNVSKRYQIGREEASYSTLREAVSSTIRMRLNGSYRKNRDAVLWALKDISLEVKTGEVIGLIGLNGAGKSTLLKILSRITEPTTGRIELYGRIGSLLEIGTGFHPELTGRENVYLNGAILGMSRQKIERKFDEIVEFSGVERFLDTPVKRYSSGMYVRLAFSVAAHMEPEILLVDEILAVGDLSFQTKCFNHVRKLRQSGITIVIVSHNMDAIRNVCERVLYLDQGRIVAFGETEEVIDKYRDKAREQQEKLDTEGQRHFGTDSANVNIASFEMSGDDGRARRKFQFGESVRIRIRLELLRRIDAPLIVFGIKRSDGVVACNFNHWYDNFKIDYLEGECTLEGWLPPLRLIPFNYEIHVLVWQRFSAHERDFNRMRPLAVRTFGEFTIEGPPLTEGDGVFQEPALKWRLTRARETIEYDGMDANSLAQAYGMKSQSAQFPQEKSGASIG